MKILLPLLLLFFHGTYSQVVRWQPMSDSSVDGKGWHGQSKELFSRLPDRAKSSVSQALWDLSRNSAGLTIRFHTNAPQITIRYTVEGSHAFSHMPATGVSGLDLYGKDRDGKWFWFPGAYRFADTISYSFSQLLSGNDTTRRIYEYQLYLPLYNTVKWLQFEFDSSFIFKEAGVRREKPIVVYGTSIAQGGCASRPGLAWTSILERKMDRPLINLGFSGNGRLDTSIINLLTEIDAKVFILDCLPNLVDNVHYPDEDLKRRLVNAVKTLSNIRPGVPIILSEHSAGSPNSGINHPAKNRFVQVNELTKEVYQELKRSIPYLYLLKSEDIDFQSDATVDGIHPADIGMEKNASAYEALLRKVLKEPVGNISTTVPVSQSRDAFYFFPERHRQVLQLNSSIKPETIFIGNSIVHMWGGQPSSSIVNGSISWKALFDSLKTVNMGYGWDRVENVLWRVHHDELDNFSPKRILVMIGTNNIGINTDDEIINGLKHLYKTIRERQPNSRLFILGILPRRDNEARVAALNARIRTIAPLYKGVFANPGQVLLKTDRKIDEEMFTDGLHPNEDGYAKLAAEIKKILK